MRPALALLGAATLGVSLCRSRPRTVLPPDPAAEQSRRADTAAITALEGADGTVGRTGARASIFGLYDPHDRETKLFVAGGIITVGNYLASGSLDTSRGLFNSSPRKLIAGLSASRPTEPCPDLRHAVSFAGLAYGAYNAWKWQLEWRRRPR